ncbi:hypothetical protein GCAAIG_07140 [Candidatus Electronema halotolerans]
MSRRKNHRGSEWRKWDLHIHAPGTKLKDQFKLANDGDIWKEYCQKLHDSDVQAFGIADYFSVDSYEAVYDQYIRRYPDSRKVFLPNIELRMIYRVNKAHEEVHLHLIFNPFNPDHKDKIKRFLSILKTNKTNDSGLNIGSPIISGVVIPVLLVNSSSKCNFFWLQEKAVTGVSQLCFCR